MKLNHIQRLAINVNLEENIATLKKIYVNKALAITNVKIIASQSKKSERTKRYQTKTNKKHPKKLCSYKYSTENYVMAKCHFEQPVRLHRQEFFCHFCNKCMPYQEHTEMLDTP